MSLHKIIKLGHYEEFIKPQKKVYQIEGSNKIYYDETTLNIA